MKILNNFLNFIKNNKKNIYFLVFLGIFFVLSNQAFAADPPKDSNAIAFNEVIGWVVILIGLLTQLVGYFLSPEWTNGVDMGILPKLKELWILVSNVVYFIFALMFVGLAFMNIIGKSDDYAFKTAIPRFIVGVIMVPLSWFIVQFVISLSSILTASVLALPFDMFADYKEKIGASQICNNIVVMKTGGEKETPAPNNDIDAADMAGGLIPATTTITPTKTTIRCGEDGKGYKEFKESLGKNMNMFSILNYYTYGVMKADKIVDVGGKTTDIFKDLFSLIGKVGFDFIFLVLYLFLILALGMALLVRGIMLWVFMVLSPLFGLLYFIKKDPKGLDKFTFQQFVSLAMVPVYVSAALSFGLLFIFVAGESINSGGDKLQFKIKEGANGTTIITSGKDGVFTATTNMLPKEKVDNSNNIASNNKAVDIILKIFGLGILWAAIVAALSSSEITKGVADPLQKIGGDALDLAKKAPTSLPIIPTSQGMMSSKNVAQSANLLKTKIDNIGNDKASRLAEDMGGKLGLKPDSQAYKKLDEIARNTAQNQGAPYNMQKIEQMLKAIDEGDLSVKSNRDKIGEILVKMGVNKDSEDFKKLLNESNVTKFSQELNGILRANGVIFGQSELSRDFRKIEDMIKDKNKGDPETPNNIILKKEGNDIKIITGTDGNGTQISTTYQITNNKIAETKVDDFAKDLAKSGINLDETELKKKLKSDEVGLKDDNQIDKIYKAYKKAKDEAAAQTRRP